MYLQRLRGPFLLSHKNPKIGFLPQKGQSFGTGGLHDVSPPLANTAFIHRARAPERLASLFWWLKPQQ